jgi:hypothetical protein
MSKSRNLADLGSDDVLETTADGVTVNGNVGIGDTDPANKLSVKNNGSDYTAVMHNSAGVATLGSVLELITGRGVGVVDVDVFNVRGADGNILQLDNGGNLSTNRSITSKNGYIICNPSTGGVALTTNDGGGNANIAFNHTDQVPDRNGSSGRIKCEVDGITAEMLFELADNVTAGVGAPVETILSLDTEGVHFGGVGNDGIKKMAVVDLGSQTTGTSASSYTTSVTEGITFYISTHTATYNHVFDVAPYVWVNQYDGNTGGHSSMQRMWVSDRGTSSATIAVSDLANSSSVKINLLAIDPCS